ncbi:hypothetical protein YC2023_016728 [Brassica napus]
MANNNSPVRFMTADARRSGNKLTFRYGNATPMKVQLAVVPPPFELGLLRFWEARNVKRDGELMGGGHPPPQTLKAFFCTDAHASQCLELHCLPGGNGGSSSTSIGANQHGDQDVLNNLTEVRSSDRTDQTDQAVPRASRLELRLEPRPDDLTDRTTARLPQPTRHSKTHGRARLSLGREETKDGHAFLSGGPSGQSRKRPYLYPVHPSGSDEPGHLD